MRATVVWAALSLTAACGGSTQPGSQQGPGGGGTATQVTIADFAFSPATVTVNAGAAVRWTNNGPSGHTATSDGALWDSGTIDPPSGPDPYGGGGSVAGTYQRSFPTQGTFAYHCAIHPTMQATVVVQ